MEHGGSDVSVVGEIADGFYVEDDVPGVPEADRENGFDAGRSLTSDGTGLGLSIATEITEAHGWEIYLGDGPRDGVRFEISGVELHCMGFRYREDAMERTSGSGVWVLQIVQPDVVAPTAAERPFLQSRGVSLVCDVE